MQSSETCGATAASHEVGVRNAIESFSTKQAMELLRGPLVTILARYMRLKIDIFVHDNNHTTQENTGGVWFFIAAKPKHHSPQQVIDFIFQL